MILALSSIFGLIAALFTVTGTFWALKFASLSKDGILKYVFYALILGNAFAIFLSPRDFAESGQYFENAIGTNFFAQWTIRLTSILLMLAAVERILYFLRQNTLDFTRLIFAFIILYAWLTSFAIPAYVTGNANIQINHFYSLVFGIGIALSLQKDKGVIILHTRNALVLFVILSLLTILIKPNHVLDLSYSQGYIPGLPRFFGLSGHATTMGLLSALAFWFLIAYPLKNQRNNIMLLALMLISLILSQSKTVLAMSVLSLPIFYLFSNSHSKPSTVNITTHSIKLIVTAIGLILLSMILLIFSLIDLEKWVYQNISPEQIHNLTTLTGRDVIWAIALEEFNRNPLFGYGGGLFSSVHRIEIGMINATDGHNQFFDTLGRAGLIGLSSNLILYVFMGYYALKFAEITKGLSLNLFLLIALYSTTAVPVTWGNLGPQNLMFFLLLSLISSNLPNPKEIRQ